MRAARQRAGRRAGRRAGAGRIALHRAARRRRRRPQVRSPLLSSLPSPWPPHVHKISTTRTCFRSSSLYQTNTAFVDAVNQSSLPVYDQSLYPPEPVPREILNSGQTTGTIYSNLGQLNIYFLKNVIMLLDLCKYIKYILISLH